MQAGDLVLGAAGLAHPGDGLLRVVRATVALLAGATTATATAGAVALALAVVVLGGLGAAAVVLPAAPLALAAAATGPGVVLAVVVRVGLRGVLVGAVGVVGVVGVVGPVASAAAAAATTTAAATAAATVAALLVVGVLGVVGAGVGPVVVLVLGVAAARSRSWSVRTSGPVPASWPGSARSGRPRCRRDGSRGSGSATGWPSSRPGPASSVVASPVGLLGGLAARRWSRGWSRRRRGPAWRGAGDASW